MNAHEITTGLPRSLHAFAKDVGRDSVTIWRWRKLGIIDEAEIVNIAGKPYLTPEGVAKFTSRALAGEFAKAHHGVAAKSS